MGALAKLADECWLLASDEGVPREAYEPEIAYKLGFLNGLQQAAFAAVAAPADPTRERVVAAMREAMELTEGTTRS